jgi:oxygen-dependent protoporphyrinogen oxidase
MHMMVPTDLSTILASPLFTEAAKRAYMGEPARAEELRETALANRGRDDDESVAAFVRRHFGDEVAETVARPLLAGILGADIEKLSARALLGPFIAMEARHGSLILGLQQRSGAHRSSVFTTLSNGLGTLVDRLQQSLPTASVRLSTTVITLDSLPTGWAVETTRGRASFDRLLIATPLDTTRQLLARLPFTQAQQAATLLPSEANSGLVVALGYRRRDQSVTAIPKGFGFLVPAASGSDCSLLACTFLDQKFPNRAPEGATLLRAFFPSSAADQLSCRSDSEIAIIARNQLIGFLGALPQRADVAIVRRWPRSLPQYEVGHLARMAQFNVCLSSLPCLLVTGNAFHGVGLPDLVRDATHAAHALVRD